MTLWITVTLMMLCFDVGFLVGAWWASREKEYSVPSVIDLLRKVEINEAKRFSQKEFEKRVVREGF